MAQLLLLPFLPVNFGTPKIETNYSGDEQWEITIDGNSGNDQAKSVVVDSQDNIFVAGFGTNIYSGASGEDWWIKKFDSTGSEITQNWNKSVDANGDTDWIYSITLDSADNLYIFGYGYNLVNLSSGQDWWIKKYSSNGVDDTVYWNKFFDGNGENDYGYAIETDENDNVYIGGMGANLLGGSTSFDWIIKKYNGE